MTKVKRIILGRLTTVEIEHRPSLYRFRYCGAVQRRIEKLTDGTACVSGTWLRLDGKRVKLSHRFTRDELERAQVELGWGRINGPLGRGPSIRLPFTALVALNASSAEIRAGWERVADQVEQDLQKELAVADRRAAQQVKKVVRLARSLTRSLARTRKVAKPAAKRKRAMP